MKEYRFKINGKDYTVCINSVSNGIADLSVNGKPYEVEIATEENSTAAPTFRQPEPTANVPAQPDVPFHPTDRSASQQNASLQENAPSQPTASGKGESYHICYHKINENVDATKYFFCAGRKNNTGGMRKFYLNRMICAFHFGAGADMIERTGGIAQCRSDLRKISAHFESSAG